MKRFLLSLLLILLFANPASAVLPTWVNNLPLWQWYSIPNTALSSVEPQGSANPCNTVQCASGPSGKIVAWNGATLKRSGSVYLIGPAGGHLDYPGNEVDALALNVATPQWVQLIAPSPASAIYNKVAFYADNHPSPTHTYYATQFDDANNRLLVMPSPTAGGPPVSPYPDPPVGYPYPDTPQIWTFSFNLNTNIYDVPTRISSFGGTGDFTAAFAVKNPVTGDIFYTRYGGNGWWKLNGTTWTQVNPAGGNPSGNYAGSALDPTRSRIFTVGGDGSNQATRLIDLNGNATNADGLLGGLGSGALPRCSSCATGYPGMVYDEVNDTFLVVTNSGSGSIDIFRVTAGTLIVDHPTTTGTAPLNRTNGIQNSVQYVPELGGIVMATTYTGNVYFMRTSLTGASSNITTFQLTSSSSGTFPFTVGLAFKKGDVPSNVALDLTNYQATIKSTWNDGSVKHVIVSGRTALTANTPKTITVTTGTPPSGTNLTTANITTANPSASVQLGAICTVTLSSLFASPVRTWISGPEMVEAHYRSNCGSDPLLQVWFHVRLYADNRVWIRAVVDNGYLDNGSGAVASNANKSYVPTVVIGGTTVYSNGGSSLTHYANTRWIAEGWIGGNPAITPKHNTLYLETTKLIPNYMNLTPSSTALNAMTQTYTPMSNVDWNPAMGNTGFQSQIGLLPLWDSLYVTSNADPRAFNSIIAQAKAINSYPIIYPSNTTKLAVRPSDFPTWSVYGPGQGGGTGLIAGSLTWDVAHHGSAGYLAYLITGDYLYLEDMQHQSATCYLISSSGNGSGTSRIFKGQTRGNAWCNRTTGQLAALSPGDTVSTDYKALLQGNVDYWNTQRQLPGQNLLGFLYSYELDTEGYGIGILSTWQQHFWGQIYGFLRDIDPLSSLTALIAVSDFMSKMPVGTLGVGGAGNFCFVNAGNYTLTVAASTTSPTGYFDDWGSVYQATFGVPNPSSCGNTLQGTSGSDPGQAAGGYWGNLMPDIAYAVDHGATGADAAWARLTGASNWSAVLTSGFNDTPIWGIVPRGTVEVPPPPTVSLSQAKRRIF